MAPSSAERKIRTKIGQSMVAQAHLQVRFFVTYNKLFKYSDNSSGRNFQNIQKIQTQNFLRVIASPASTGKNWQEKIY
jgi:hypothetical protein